MISPAQLEIYLRRFEVRLSEYCGARLKWATPFAAIILVLMALWIKSILEMNTHLQPFGMFPFVRQSRFVMPLLFACAGISIFFKGTARGWYSALVTMLSWGLNCYIFFLGKVPIDVFVLITLLLPLNSIFTYYIGTARRKQQTRATWVLVLLGYFTFSWLYISGRLYALEEFSMLLLFWKFKLQYMVLVAIQLAYAYSPRPVDPFLAYNPATATHGVLWPVVTVLARKNRPAIAQFWWKGFWGVVLGYLIIYLKVQLDKAGLDRSGNILVKSTVKYVLLILSDVGAFNVITGVARLFGYRVRDATSFSWLARTPAEYWRRGSVYHYEFINRYLFLRLWRLIRSRFIVTFVCFFFFYIMKNGVFDVGIMILNWAGSDIHGGIYRNPDLRYSVILFFLHFLLLYITQRYWFFQWSNNRSIWTPWASVITTYVLQISTIILAIILSTNWHSWLMQLQHLFG